MNQGKSHDEQIAATTLRCDGSCGYTTTEGKFGDRCPNCDYGVLVEDEDADA